MNCAHFLGPRAAVCVSNVLIGLTLILPAPAQDSKSGIGTGPGPLYDAARETTLTGTIAEVVTKPEAGGVGGVHLLVNGPEGIVDAHLGSFLSQPTQAAFHAGMPVQIVGAPMQVRDKEYFMARELTMEGRTVVIRSGRGFFLHARADRGMPRTKAAKGEQP